MEAAVWKNDEIAARLDESSAVEEVEAEEELEELEEAVHVCPLCVSQLDESIDEERILEHLNVVLGLVDRLSQLNEGDEDIESVIDETIAELLFQDDEEE
jgi:DNA repair exonuclease SbcCD ATPase subunit